MGIVSNLRSNASFYVVMFAIALTSLATTVALIAVLAGR
jgi:hypothetical protein